MSTIQQRIGQSQRRRNTRSLLGYFSICLLLQLGLPRGSSAEDEPLRLHRQQFHNVEDAVEQARIEVARDHKFGIAAIILSVTSMDSRPFRGSSKLRTIGNGGYMPGRIQNEVVELIPLFVWKPTRAIELEITVPGHERFVRRTVVRPGDILIWNDVELTPLNQHNTGTISGRVWLEDNDASLDGILITVDGEDMTFTDKNGRFAADRVREGKVQVQARRHNVVFFGQEVEVIRGRESVCQLEGFMPRYAQVRWVYQPNGSRSFRDSVDAGEAVLVWNKLHRVSFAKGFKATHSKSDFIVEQTKDTLVYRHFDVTGRNGPGSIRMRNTAANSVMEAPRDGYAQEKWTMRPGDLFVIRCYDGQHYGLLEVVDITSTMPEID